MKSHFILSLVAAQYYDYTDGDYNYDSYQPKDMTTLYPSTEPPATIATTTHAPERAVEVKPVGRESEPNFVVGMCWACSVTGPFENQADVAKQCKETGHLTNCFDGNRGCDTVMRKRGGVILSLQMGCTGKQSCEANAKGMWII